MSGGRKSEKRVALAPDFGCGFVAAIPLRGKEDLVMSGGLHRAECPDRAIRKDREVCR
jgi:hypothetical protein